MDQDKLTDFFKNVDNIVEEDFLKLKRCLDRIPKQRSKEFVLIPCYYYLFLFKVLG